MWRKGPTKQEVASMTHKIAEQIPSKFDVDPLTDLGSE
jgi:hypothetical protein